ncbi:hypothetical protein PBRA_002456 [Plasmodiophora brassicae]|uniref:Transmembrane protein n=1 Tax=Plasmodiophora brassicae TaxID=37360 RepID=A0A0G4J4L4_PLABS|nr:hypothetical protein PBRA_002456 [Plasmodiophora brassicae]
MLYGRYRLLVVVLVTMLACSQAMDASDDGLSGEDTGTDGGRYTDHVSASKTASSVLPRRNNLMSNIDAALLVTSAGFLLYYLNRASPATPLNSGFFAKGLLKSKFVSASTAVTGLSLAAGVAIGFRTAAKSDTLGHRLSWPDSSAEAVPPAPSPEDDSKPTLRRSSFPLLLIICASVVGVSLIILVVVVCCWRRIVQSVTRRNRRLNSKRYSISRNPSIKVIEISPPEPLRRGQIQVLAEETPIIPVALDDVENSEEQDRREAELRAQRMLRDADASSRSLASVSVAPTSWTTVPYSFSTNELPPTR